MIDDLQASPGPLDEVHPTLQKVKPRFNSTTRRLDALKGASEADGPSTFSHDGWGSDVSGGSGSACANVASSFV
jgi:hypothetical protein